jgi:hypothetical protein
VAAHVALDAGDGMMKAATILCFLGAAVTGFIAAYQWYQSAKVPPPPPGRAATTLIDSDGLTALGRSLRDTANKNKSAAGWTAGAVFLNAIGSVLSLMG